MVRVSERAHNPSYSLIRIDSSKQYEYCISLLLPRIKLSEEKGSLSGVSLLHDHVESVK